MTKLIVYLYCLIKLIVVIGHAVGLVVLCFICLLRFYYYRFILIYTCKLISIQIKGVCDGSSNDDYMDAKAQLQLKESRRGVVVSDGDWWWGSDERGDGWKIICTLTTLLLVEMDVITFMLQSHHKLIIKCRIFPNFIVKIIQVKKIITL